MKDIKEDVNKNGSCHFLFLLVFSIMFHDIIYCHAAAATIIICIIFLLIPL